MNLETFVSICKKHNMTWGYKNITKDFHYVQMNGPVSDECKFALLELLNVRSIDVKFSIYTFDIHSDTFVKGVFRLDNEYSVACFWMYTK